MLTKRQYIWNLINQEKYTCRAVAEAYIINAKAQADLLGVTQMCQDGFPHAGKIGQRDPKWDKIKYFIAQAREQYNLANPHPIHQHNKLAKYNQYNLGKL